MKEWDGQDSEAGQRRSPIRPTSTFRTAAPPGTSTRHRSPLKFSVSHRPATMEPNIYTEKSIIHVIYRSPRTRERGSHVFRLLNFRRNNFPGKNFPPDRSRALRTLLCAPTTLNLNFTFFFCTCAMSIPTKDLLHK